MIRSKGASSGRPAYASPLRTWTFEYPSSASSSRARAASSGTISIVCTSLTISARIADWWACPVPPQQVGGAPRQLRYDFHRLHVLNDLREDRGLVARSRAHLQDAMRGRELKRLGHVRDDVGLRNCLAEADGKSAVVVRGAGLVGRNEAVVRHGAHRRK